MRHLTPATSDTHNYSIAERLRILQATIDDEATPANPATIARALKQAASILPQVASSGEGSVDCPICNGKGAFSAYKAGFVLTPEQDELFGRCANCKATGKVTPEHAERLVRGVKTWEARIKAGRSRPIEAQRLGVSEHQLKRFEYGENVKPHIAEAILAGQG